MRTIKETCYKGTRILLGDTKRDIINNMIRNLKSFDENFTEIQIPIIQYQELFSNKVGEENNNLMFNFTDRGDRKLCLAPEYTAVVQALAKSTFKDENHVALFYVVECFRGEKPQNGRYRQFTQFGVEILNPYYSLHQKLFDIPNLAMKILTNDFTENVDKFIINTNVSRGLDYYTKGKGFEIICEELGSAKQIVGGGCYEGGVGFAIGIDRLLMLYE